MKKDIVFSGLDLQLINEQIRLDHLELVSKKQDWYSLVAIQYAKDNNLPLNEGILDSIKDLYNKAVRGYKSASLEKGGKIIGRSAEAEKAKQEFANTVVKIAKNQVTKSLISQVQNIAPRFPNTDEGGSNTKGEQEFRNALFAIGQIYDSVVAAAEKGPKAQDGMDIASANAIIKAMRDYVKYNLDFQLGDHYKHFLKEQEELGQGEQYTGAARAGKSGSYSDESTAVKGLKSNKAPLILAALGGLGVGYGWLAKQSWFVDLLRDPGQIKTFITHMTSLEQKGVTEHFATLLGKPGTNISGMKLSDFISGMKTNGLVDASGNPTANLINMAKDGGNTNFANWWATNIAGADPNSTLEKIIPLSGAGAPNAGGQIFTKKVVSAITKKFVSGGLSAAATTLVNMGPLASTLGISLVAAGAAVKALRMKGKVSSRAALMGLLMNQMVDLDKEEVPPQPPIIDPPPPPEPQPPPPGPDPTPGPTSDQPMFYVKKSGGNTLRRTSLNTWLSRQLSEPMANMQLTGKTAKGLINGIVKIAYDSLQGQGATIQEAKYNFDPSIARAFLGGGVERGKKNKDEDYPVDTSRKHKYSVPVSGIQKFVRDYYQKNAPEGAKKDETMMGQNLANLTGEVLTLIKKWIKYQTDSSKEQLRGKKDSEERIKKAKETLGINESQILRWKQIAGILKD